ncbi:hypothetical protein HK101_011947, partial [Irineochytrium annulatum]
MDDSVKPFLAATVTAHQKKSAGGLPGPTGSAAAITSPTPPGAAALALTHSPSSANSQSKHVFLLEIICPTSTMPLLNLPASVLPTLEAAKDDQALKYTLGRSFEEFVEFHTALLRLIKQKAGGISDSDIVAATTSGQLTLPRKRIFMTKAALEERRVLLNIYLKDLLQLSAPILRSSAVVSFLGPNSQDFARYTSTPTLVPLTAVKNASPRPFLTLEVDTADALKRVNVGLDEDWLSAIEQKRKSRAFLLAKDDSLDSSTMKQALANIYEEAARSLDSRESVMVSNFKLAYAAADVDPRLAIPPHLRLNFQPPKKPGPQSKSAGRPVQAPLKRNATVDEVGYAAVAAAPPLDRSISLDSTVKKVPVNYVGLNYGGTITSSKRY